MKSLRLPRFTLLSWILAGAALLAAPAMRQGHIGTSVLNITPSSGVTITIRQKQVTARTLEADVTTNQTWRMRGIGPGVEVKLPQGQTHTLLVARAGPNQAPKVTLGGEEVQPVEKESIRSGRKYYSVGADVPSEQEVNLAINFEGYELVVKMYR